MRISHILSKIQTMRSALWLYFFLIMGCTGNDYESAISEDQNFQLQTDNPITQIRAVNTANIRASVIINGTGARTAVCNSNGNCSVPGLSRSEFADNNTAIITWWERYNGTDLLLAEYTGSFTLDDNGNVTWSGTYVSEGDRFDADNDGVSNLAERIAGTEPLPADGNGPTNTLASTVDFELAAQKEQITIVWNNTDTNNESFDVCISLDPDFIPTNCLASTDAQLLVDQQSPVVVTGLENKDLYFVTLLSKNDFGYNSSPIIKSAFTIGQGVWRVARPFPSVGQRDSRGYSIGSTGYIAITSTNEHWAYRSDLDEWLQVSNLPNIGFQSPIITIDDSAYFFSGNEVWKYDSITDSFSAMGDSPGESKRAAFSFVIDGKAYIGGGFFNKTAFWEYNPIDDSWILLNDLPGLQYVNNNDGGNYPIDAFASVLDGRAFLGGTNMYFWEYDPSSMSWERLNDIGSITYGTTFKIDENGAYYYASGIGLFYYSVKVGEFYQVASPPRFTCGPASFSVNQSGFMVSGADHSSNTCTLDVVNDLYVFEDG